MAKFKIQDISIRLKITILSFIVLFFAISLALIFGTFQQKISAKRSYLTNTYLKKNNLLNNSQRIINSFIVFNHISFEKLDDFIDIQNSFFQTNDSIIQITKKYQNLTTTVDENLIVDDFSTEYQTFQNVIYEIFNEYKKEEINLKNISRLFNKELLSYQNLTDIIKYLKIKNNNNFSTFINSIEENIQKLILQTILSFILFGLLLLFSAIVFFRDDLKLPLIIEPYLENLSKGETLKKVTEKTNKSEIIESINGINNNYQRINNYIKELQNKNYQFELTNLGEKDIISSSIQELRTQLASSQEELELRHKEDQQKEWANTGINNFSELMRQHSNNLTILSDEIIKAFVKYLNASVGGLFIVQDTENKTPYLELLAAFAYDRKKYYSKRIQFGEGLIGTVAIDQTTIHLNQIPEDYLEIESGLGNSSPNNLLILPLLTDNGLLGIIEIAALSDFEQYKIDFSESLSRSIAATLEAVKINARTIDLLKESQKKSDELANREKVLQETMVEVNKAHQIAKLNEIEMTGILTGVDQTLMRAEYSVNGKFINSNLVHRQTMGYDIELMKGKNILEFIQEEEKETFKKMWAEVASGKPYQITVKRQNKQTNEDIWLLNQYTPIKDEKGKVIKILYLAIDITEQKQAEQMAGDLLAQTQEKEVELKGVLSGIDRTIMRAEYSVKGEFINSNEVHQSIMGYDLKEMVGKSILDFIPDDQKDSFNRLWREVASGKAKELTVKRTNKSTGQDIWLINQYNPIFDENKKVNRILYLAIDITEQKRAEAKAQDLLTETQKKEIELRGIFAGIDQAIMRAEYLADGTFVDANDIHSQTMGYEIENMKGKNIMEFISSEDKADFTKIWESVKKGNLEQITVQRTNKITGDDIWLLNQYTPIEDETGNIIKILYLAIDITEQKQTEQMAEELLVDSQKKEFELQGVLSGIDRTIMRARYSVDGIFLDANEVHRTVMGYEIEDMTGKNIMEFIPDKEIEEFKKTWNEVAAGNPKELIVQRFNKTTNEPIWLKNQYNPIFDTSGKINEILYLGIDVTEQKISEENSKKLLIETEKTAKILKERDKKLQKAIGEAKKAHEEFKENQIELLGVLSGIDQTLMRAEYDLEGNFIDANQIHVQTLGYDLKKMKGQNILEFIPEEEKEEFLSIWGKVKNGSLEQIVVKRKNKKTNEDIWILNQYTPIKDSSEKTTRILYLGMDISEQKRLENELVVQEQIMTQNMEELFKEFEKAEEENDRLRELEEEISENFDSKQDKLYRDWINSL